MNLGAAAAVMATRRTAAALNIIRFEMRIFFAGACCGAVTTVKGLSGSKSGRLPAVARSATGIRSAMFGGAVDAGAAGIAGCGGAA